MKQLLIALLLLNVILSTVWACGSGRKPAHYGVFQARKTTGPAATNSIVVATNKVSVTK